MYLLCVLSVLNKFDALNVIRCAVKDVQVKQVKNEIYLMNINYKAEAFVRYSVTPNEKVRSRRIIELTLKIYDRHFQRKGFSSLVH